MRVTTLIFDYVCATCWGQLIERERLGEMQVQCAPYGVLHAGFHRRDTAERGRERSGHDLDEFIRLYQDTEFAYDLGLKKRPVERTREEWAALLVANKKQLGRSDGLGF